jgi:hypothetical protein
MIELPKGWRRKLRGVTLGTLALCASMMLGAGAADRRGQTGWGARVEGATWAACHAQPKGHAELRPGGQQAHGLVAIRLC